MEELLRGGKSAGEPEDVGGIFTASLEGIPVDALMPVESPMPGGTGAGRRLSGGGDISGMTADLGTQAPAPRDARAH